MSGAVRVLIVDDSPEDRAIFHRFLERDPVTPYEVVEAASVEKATELCESDCPDCVLLDHSLPDDDGLALLKMLRSRYGPHRPAIVMVTGSGNEGIAVAAMKRGAQDYLLKSEVTAPILRRAVINALEKVQLMREVEQNRTALAEQHERERAARQQVQSILESIADAFFALDEGWRFTYVNHAAERLLGRPREALLGRNVWDEFPDAVGSPFYLNYHEAIRSGQPVSFEAFYAPLDRWFDVRAYPSREGLSIYFQDINARRMAEAAQRASEERLARVIETAREGIVLLDMEGRIRLANRAAQHILGTSEAETLARSYADPQWAFSRVDGSPLLPEELPYARVAATEHPVQDVALAVGRPDGRRMILSVNAAPLFDEAGHIEGVITSFRDVTSTVEQANALTFLDEASRALGQSLDFDATLDRMVRLAVPTLADLCVVHLRHSASELRRTSTAHSDPANQALLDALPLTLPLAPHSPLWPVIEQGSLLSGPAASHALVDSALAPTPVGAYPPALLLPLMSGEGHPFGLLTLARTRPGALPFSDREQALAEEMARRAALALENARLYRTVQEALRERDSFLSVASHELRSPLTAMLGRAELMLRRADRLHLEADVTNGLEIIRAQGGRMRTLLDDLLDISRVERGQLAIEQEPVELGALLHRVVEEMEPTLRDHTLRVAVTTEPMPLLGDAGRLDQVFRNLLANAAKYSQVGSTIHLSANRVGTLLEVDVRDQGIGIEAEALPHLFERFYRAPSATEQGVSGSGVGLFVVQEIVRHHGGQVHVESQPGAGSHFIVTLPAHEPQRASG